jgi:hypothetical protein
MSAGSYCHEIEDVGKCGIISSTRIAKIDDLISVLKQGGMEFV